MVDTPNQSKPEDAARQIQALVRAAQVPKFYANGLGLALSASDISIIFLDQNAPVASIALALPTAKTLLNEIERALGEFEAKTGQKIPTVQELIEKLQKP